MSKAEGSRKLPVIDFRMFVKEQGLGEGVEEGGNIEDVELHDGGKRKRSE